jgi:hypothetical protein
VHLLRSEYSNPKLYQSFMPDDENGEHVLPTIEDIELEYHSKLSKDKKFQKKLIIARWRKYEN